MIKTPTATFRTFEREERAKQQKIINYSQNPKSNYVPLDWRLRRSLAPHSATDWVGADGRARIIAVDLLRESLTAQMPVLRRNSPVVSSVLITARAWLVDLRGPHAETVEAVKEAVRRVCWHENYFGVIEPGFYPREELEGSASKGAVSWHAHIVVWGRDRVGLCRRLEAYSASTPGILKGLPPADYRRRSWNTALYRLTYSLKTPARSYIRVTVSENIDPATGEIRAAYDWQRAQRLRVGEHVQMRNILADFRLDDLIVVGGSGQELIQRLRDRMISDREKEIAALSRGPKHPLSVLPDKIKI